MFAELTSLVRRFWSAAPVATALLALALAASAFFGARSVVFWYDRPPVAERQQPIEAWMTPRYVVRSWHVPRDVVLDAIGVSPPLPRGPVSLEELAELRGVPVEQVIGELEAAITAYKEVPRGRDSETGRDK